MVEEGVSLCALHSAAADGTAAVGIPAIVWWRWWRGRWRWWWGRWRRILLVRIRRAAAIVTAVTNGILHRWLATTAAAVVAASTAAARSRAGGVEATRYAQAQKSYER